MCATLLEPHTAQTDPRSPLTADCAATDSISEGGVVNGSAAKLNCFIH